MRHLAATTSGGWTRAITAVALAVGALVPAFARAKVVTYPSLPLALRWSVEGEWQQQGSGLALTDSRVIVITRSQQVKFLDLVGHNEVWSIDEPGATSVTAGDGLVFTASNRRVVALDESTHGRKWTITLPKVPSWTGWRFPGLAAPPLWCTGWLFVADTAGVVTAYRSADGTAVWTYKAGAPLAAPITVDGAMLALAQTDKSIVVLDLLTGHERWRTQLSAVANTILAAGGRIYVGTEDRLFYYLSADSRGRPEREIHYATAKLVGAPVVDERDVCAAGVDGIVRAFDRGNGSLRWPGALAARPAPALVVDHGVLFVPLTTGEIQLYLTGPGLPLPLTEGTPAGKLAAGQAGAQFAPPAVSAGSGSHLMIATLMTLDSTSARLSLYAHAQFTVGPLVVGPGTPIHWPPDLPPSRP